MYIYVYIQPGTPILFLQCVTGILYPLKSLSQVPTVCFEGVKSSPNSKNVTTAPLEQLTILELNLTFPKLLKIFRKPNIAR